MLSGSVCLVTGAARGIGKGIALQLGQAGATVYITGRTEKNLLECSAEIKKRGGNPIIVQMDHANDADVENLFERIKKEQNGKLDVLVNNAYAGVNQIFTSSGKKFYETDPFKTWDVINGVGLRGHYMCTTLGSRLMVARGEGLIINISSPGGPRYLFNVAYGIGKAAVDRMSADCAVELKDKNVAVITLWPQAVRTEYIEENMLTTKRESNKMFEEGETIEFAGKAVVHLAADKNIIKRTGKIVNTVDVANEFGFKDIDGTLPSDFRSVRYVLYTAGWRTLSTYVPEFIKIPNFLIHFASYKF